MKLKCGLHRQQQDAVQGRAKPTSLVCHTHSQTETRMDCMLYELVPFGEENEVIANNNISTHLHVCACEDVFLSLSGPKLEFQQLQQFICLPEMPRPLFLCDEREILEWIKEDLTKSSGGICSDLTSCVANAQLI